MPVDETNHHQEMDDVPVEHMNIDEQTAPSQFDAPSMKTTGGNYSPNGTLNCLSSTIFVVSIITLAGGLFCVMFLLGYSVPLFRYAKSYNKSIVESNACYLTNETDISYLYHTKVGSYFDVTQNLATTTDDGAQLILEPAFCGRFISRDNVNRTTLVERLLAAYPKDSCLSRIDAVNQTFPCWYNQDETSLSDPRVTAQELSEYKLLIAVISIIAFIMLLVSIGLIIFSTVVILRDNMNDRTGGRKSTGFMMSLLTNMGLQACTIAICFIMPWLGWILWPIGTYIGFLVFAVVLGLLIIFVVATVVSLILFRVVFKRVHIRYFKIMLIVFLGVSLAGILYQVAMVYPVGVWGLQFLSRSDFLPIA